MKVGVAFSLASGYRTLVFAGLYSIDAPRQEFLRTLKAGGRSLVFLGVKSGWPVQFRSVTRHAVKEESGQCVLARYAEDGAPAVAARQEKGWRSFFICDAGGLTPDFFRRIVAESGGFAPAPVGVQVNMSGNFISLHAARNARFDFPLPFDCAVTDLRSGRPVPTNGRVLPLELKVGDSRWLGLKEVRCDD